MRLLGPPRSWMDAPPSVEPLRFRKAPMLSAALCFAAGDIAARNWHTPFALVAATTLLLALAIFGVTKHLRIGVWPVLALWVAAGCWCAQIQPPVAPQHALRQYADGLSRNVRGHVVRVRRIRAQSGSNIASTQLDPDNSDADASSPDTEPTMESVDVQVDAVEEITPDVSSMVPIGGGVRVSIQTGQPQLSCGDVLEVPLQMRVPETYRDPGAWSYADDLSQQGIGVQANVKAERVRRIGSWKPTWRCRLYAAQFWASRHIDGFVASHANQSLPATARLNAEDASMLQAMLFGDRAMLRHTLRTGFERTGTFHLFVVSGLHVAILAGGLFWLLRRLRMPEGPAVLATIAITGGYALVTGFGAPVQRAFIMSAAYLAARWLGRERSALNALGAAALAVLALDPRALFESSFQMTMLVIVALGGVAAPLGERLFARWREAQHELWTIRLDASLPPRTAQLRVQLRMVGTLCSGWPGRWSRDLPLWMLRLLHRTFQAVLFGLAAEICMMLPMAVYFHRATLLALPLNAVCIPIVGVLLCAAIVTFCISLISATAATVPAAITAILLHVVRGTVDRLSHIRLADLRAPEPAPAAIVAACVAMAFVCWALRARQRVWVATGVVALVLVPFAVLWPEPATVQHGVLEVTALDVGQGDSLFIVSPDGHTLLVDAGGPIGRAPSSALQDDRWDIGEEVVAPYLWSRRIRRLDAVLLTHAHSDHMGGMPAILRDFHPRELWLSVQPGKSPALAALLEEASRQGTQIRWSRAGDTFMWNGLRARALSPAPQYANPGDATNDDSLVMRLSFGRASVLLEGDAEAHSEQAMVDSGELAPTTLLKVGHHGSKTSTNPAFLAAVAPRDAVISVGRRNTFGHPRFEVLQRLEDAGVRTYRTDRAGAETFLLRSDGGISAHPAASN